MEDMIPMLEDCEARESKMTEWECGFIQSIREQIDRGAGMSLKQYETLEKIWEKVT